MQASLHRSWPRWIRRTNMNASPTCTTTPMMIMIRDGTLNKKYSAGRKRKQPMPRAMIDSAYSARHTRIVTVVTLPEIPPECIMM